MKHRADVGAAGDLPRIPRRNRRGLIEARGRPIGEPIQIAKFPGEIAGASLKPVGDTANVRAWT